MRNYTLIGIVLCLAAIGASIALSGSATRPEAPVPAATSTKEIIATSTLSGIIVGADTIAETAPPPEGYVRYTNTEYGLSFYHSPIGKITEYDEGQGAMTVVLQNESLVRGMQVFIVPYTESLITEERFRADVPSGVREDAEDATLDGVRAVTFTSEDMLLGPTREIWIIRNGYLYEITTFKGAGTWFTPVIQSWRWL